MTSIFDLERRINIDEELKRLVNIIFYKDDAVNYFSNKYNRRMVGSLSEYINDRIFLTWKYRDTCINIEEYLNSIGCQYSEVVLTRGFTLDEKHFLRFLEFFANMFRFAFKDEDSMFSNEALAIFENLPRILEKMNYQTVYIEDRVIIKKRNADVDSVIELVPKDISFLLLEYNDFRIKDDINRKKELLKDIDMFLDESKIKKQMEGRLLNSIETVLNKMGINHPNVEKPFTSFSNKELMIWYDKCFLMMLHAIRSIEINKIKNERDTLFNNIK